MSESENPGKRVFERFARIAENLRPRRVVTPEPPPEPTKAERVAVLLQGWATADPATATFLPYLNEQITIANSESRRAFMSIHSQPAAFYGGYEAALRDVRTAFLAWREGHPPGQRPADPSQKE